MDYILNGTIPLIHFILNDHDLDIFGEHFKLPKKLIYSYAQARIVSGLRQIQVYSGDELVTSDP